MNEKELFLMQKCRAAFDEEDYESLLKNAEELEKVARNRYNARFYKGVALYHAKKFAEAREIFYKLYLEKYVRTKVEDDITLYYLALSNLYFGEVRNAITILRKLEKRDLNNIDVRLILYIALYIAGDREASAIELARALSLDSKKTIVTLESILEKALEHSHINNAAKVLLVEMARELGAAK